MSVLNELAEAWWAWMAPMFWQVSLLIIIVAVIDRLMAGKVWPQVGYVLWLLVLVNLVLPPDLSSPASLTAYVFRDRGVKVDSVAMPATVDVNIPAAITPVVSDELPAEFALVPTDWAPATVSRPKSGVYLSRAAYLMAVWWLGVVLLGFWAILRYRSLRREYLGDGDEVGSAPLVDLLHSTAAALELRRVPEIVFSSRLSSPAVFGVFRPVLVLPKEYRDREPDAATHHVLLHELAHIKRRDLWVHALAVCLQIVYWFHPLLWLVHRRTRHLCELCCDATVASVLREETGDYRTTLMETAERLVRSNERFGIGLLGLVERPGGLVARLRWLEKKVWRYSRLRMAAVFTTVAAALVLLLPMARSKTGDVVASETKLVDREDAVSGRALAELKMSPEAKGIGEILDGLRKHVRKAYADVGLSEEEVDELLRSLSQAGPPQKMIGIWEAYGKARGGIQKLERDAAEELAALGPEVVPELLAVRSATRGEGALDNVIMEAVIRIGGHAVPHLIDSLSDETWEMRFDTAMALGWIGDSGAVEPLIQVLSDPETRVVRAAVRSLGQLKDERAGDPLLTLWKENRLEKGTIAEALVAIGDDRVAGLAREELEKLAADADKAGDWQRRGHKMLVYVRAVGAFRDRNAIPLLKRLLSAPPQETKGPGPRYLVAEEAAVALRSMRLLVVGDEMKGGYQVVADSSPEGEDGLILFSDGTVLTGKVFLTGPEGDWVRMDRQGYEVVFVARNGEEDRYSSNSKWLGHQYLFVKVGEGWRPALGERWPRLTERDITTVIFGAKPTESERKEFRKYFWEWVAQPRQVFRKAVGERMRAAAEEQRPPGSEKWSAEMKTCYRNLLMIGKAADAYVSVFASEIGRMDAEQAAEVEIEELFGYFYLEPPKCPGGGVYSHRSFDRSYQHGCSLHGTIEEFGPARKGAFSGVGTGPPEKSGSVDQIPQRRVDVSGETFDKIPVGPEGGKSTAVESSPPAESGSPSEAPSGGDEGYSNRIGEILDRLRADVRRVCLVEGLTEEEVDALLEGKNKTELSQKLDVKVHRTIWQLQRGAAEELAGLGAPAVPELLETRLRTLGDFALGLATTDAVWFVGGPGIQYLIDALSDERGEMRCLAAFALKAGGSRAVDPLIAVLSDPDTQVIRGAVWSLGRIGDPRAADPLLKAWEEVSDERGYIADALLAIGDERTAGPVEKELQKAVAEVEETGNWDSKIQALGAYARVLGTFNVRSAIPILERMLSAPPRRTGNPKFRYSIAEEAAKALRSMGLVVVGDIQEGGYRVVEAHAPEEQTGAAVVPHASDQSITDHNILKPAHNHLLLGDYDAACEKASQISELEGLDPSILVRAYSIMAKALTFGDKEERFEEFLREVIGRHATDSRPVHANRPMPMSRYCRILAQSERTFHLQRLGRYREAAEACERRIREEERNLKYFPPSQRPGEEFRVRSILWTDVGDLYRFAGEYEKAAEAYEAALKYLTQEYVDDESLKYEVSLPMPAYLRGKLPRVIAWCRGNPDELEVKLGREVDTPLELAESHLNRGNTYKDGRSVGLGLELLKSVEELLERENVPESLTESLRSRYAEVKDKVGQNIMWAKELAASGR